MKHLVEQPHILMSVENPYYDVSSNINHEEAVGILSGGGKLKNVHSAKGKYGKPENTIFISNPTQAQQVLARKVAEQTGQDSVIESDGFSHKMVTVNGPEKGKTINGKGTTWHEQEPENYYTTLPTGEHFTHNFEEASAQATDDLEKGSKGDWQKEGYTLTVHPDDVYENYDDGEADQPWNPKKHPMIIFAHDKNGKKVGHLKVLHANAENRQHLIFPSSVEVNEDHRRKGLGSSMYAYAEKISGKKMVPNSAGHSDDAEQMWNQPNRPFGKSAELEKSKNVRRWKEALFGPRGDPSATAKRKKTATMVYDYGDRTETVEEPLKPKTFRQAQMEALSRLSEKKLKKPVVRAKGKIVNLQTMERDPNYKGKSPKPDWRSGELESEPTAQAVSHEIGHAYMLPKGVSFRNAQEWMDEGSAEAGRLVDKEGKKRTGAAKQTEREVVPMGAENPIRRRAGVTAYARPQNMSSVYGESSKKKLRWEHPERRTVDTDRPMAVRIADKKGNPVDLIGVSQNLRPEDKQRIRDIDESTIQLDDEKGWIPDSTSEALINLRGRGQFEEARSRAKSRFAPSAPAEPQQPAEQSKPMTMDDLLSHQGSVDELKEKIKQFAASQPKKLASSEEMSKSEQLRKRCWEGYKAVPGKKPYSKGSCEPVSKADKPFHNYNPKKHSKTGGLNDEYRKKVNREEGSNLKRPVTGKVKAGSKAAGRRKSFCARMSGVKGPTSKEGKLTPKGAALKRWKCSKSEESYESLQKSARDYKNMLGDVSQHKEAFETAKKMPNSNWGMWVTRNYKQNPEKFHQVKHELNHFAGSQHIPEVSKVRFDKDHDFDSGIKKLKDAESQYNNRIVDNTNIVEPTESTKKILDVGNGMAWYSLGRGSCSAEGAAMVHCGNVPSEQEHHDVLSLRTSHNIGGKEYHEPHVTFINDKDTNILGEMKGRANEKPHPKYHEAIAKLLAQGYVPLGGGYAEENNFHIDDLSPKLRAHVLQHNPEAFVHSSDPKLSAKALEGFDFDTDVP